MRITPETLEHYDACPAGITWLKENYPDGVETSDLIHQMPSDPTFIVWALRYLRLTPEEESAAFEALHIKKSARVRMSWNVTNSSAIYGSHDIVDSNRVGSSENVTRSKDVYHSTLVTDSSNISNCNNIEYSRFVYGSSNISFSSYIHVSDSISWSHAIINSLNIEDGVFSELCKNSTYITLCEAVENSQNCCLCFGMNGVSSYLFNKPSTATRVDEVQRHIRDLYNDEYEVSKNLATFFSTISAPVINYIKSLPEYCEVPGAAFNL